MEDLARQVGSLTLNRASNNEPEGDKNVPENQVDNPNDTNQPSDGGNVAADRTIQSSDDDAVATDQTNVLSTIKSRDFENVAKDQITTSDDEEMPISQDNIFNSTIHPIFDDEKTIAESDSFNDTSLSRIEDMTGTFLSTDQDIAMSQSDITNSFPTISDDNDTTDQAEISNNTIQPSHDKEMVKDQDNKPPHITYQITDDHTQLPDQTDSINVFYANARSICKEGNLGELKRIIKMIPKTVHLILITETWENENNIFNSSLDMENYIPVLGNRVGDKQGGVAAYIHQDMRYSDIHQTVQDSYTEVIYDNGNHYLWVFFDDPRLSIGVVYYPGDSCSDQPILRKDLKQQLTRQRDCNAVVLGDFKVEPENSNDFENVLKDREFKILNNKSEEYFTQKNITNHNITKTSVTDLVCSNIKGIDCHLALIDSSLSDHRQVYFEIRNPEIFIENQPLDSSWRKTLCEAKNSKAENEDLYSLEDEMIQIINKFSKDVRQDYGKICKSKIKKQLCHQNYRHDPNAEDKNLKADEAVELEIRNRKKEYEILTLIENRFNKKIIPSTITHESKSISNKEDICQLFNNNFAAKISSPKKLQKPNTISDVSASSKEDKIKRLSVLPPCTHKEINKIILSLDPYLGAGVFGIEVTKIRLSNKRKEISNVLCTCFNKYFETGYFPDCLKILKVNPVFDDLEGKHKTNLKNYAFEQVLPVFARILEKLIWKRIHSFVPVHYVTENQYGYREKTNSASRTIDIVSKINTSIHKNNIALGLFIDLKKAFNNVDHALLLRKLDDLGIVGPAFKILKSYLQNRTHVVMIGKFESELKHLTRGLPQGSILGHLLFFIYINRVSNLNLNGEITLSPEKISLFCHGRVEDVFYKANRNLRSISKWFRDNGLTIDPGNVEYVIFNHEQDIPTNFSLKLDDTKIKDVEKVKFFGLTLDSKLTWTTHIKNIKENLKLVANVSLEDISKNTGTLYNACLKPNTHLIEIWGTEAETKYFDDLLSPLLNKLKNYSPKLNNTLLSTKQLMFFKRCLLVHKNLFISQLSDHSADDRSTSTGNTGNPNGCSGHFRHQIVSARISNVSVNILESEFGKHNISVMGGIAYNKLPDEMRVAGTLKTFRKNLRAYCTSTSENLATDRASGSGSTTKKNLPKSPSSEQKKEKETARPRSKKSSKSLKSNATL